MELTASIQNERKCLVCLYALEPLGGGRWGEKPEEKAGLEISGLLTAC